MNCDRARDQMAAVAAGEIGPEDRRELEIHVGVCPDCAGEQDRLARLFDRVRGLGVDDPGPDYWASYNRRIRQRIEAPVAARWLRTARFLPVAVAAALVLAAVLLTVRRDGPAWRTGDPGAGREAATPARAAATPVRTSGGETDFEAVLTRATAARGADSVQRVLDDMLSDDPWLLDDDLSRLSGEEREALAEELTGV